MSLCAIWFYLGATSEGEHMKCTLLSRRKVVGHVEITVREDEYYIDQLYVEPPFRGHGYATRLLKQVPLCGRTRNSVTAYVSPFGLGGGRLASKDLFRFYKRHGMRRITRGKKWVTGDSKDL